LPALITSVADVAALVPVTTMRIEFIFAIEPLPAEPTFRMTSESTLVDCSWVVVAELLVLPQLVLCKELMFMCEDFLVPGTQITHDLLVNASHMSM